MLKKVLVVVAVVVMSMVMFTGCGQQADNMSEGENQTVAEQLGMEAYMYDFTGYYSKEYGVLKDEGDYGSMYLSIIDGEIDHGTWSTNVTAMEFENAEFVSEEDGVTIYVAHAVDANVDEVYITYWDNDLSKVLFTMPEITLDDGYKVDKVQMVFDYTNSAY